MKKTLLFLLLSIFCVSFTFAISDKQQVENVIHEFQDAINCYDKDRVKNVFEDKTSFDNAFELFDIYYAMNLSVYIEFGILETKIANNLAEVTAKMYTKISPKSETLECELFEPQMFNILFELRKNNGIWKIVDRKPLD